MCCCSMSMPLNGNLAMIATADLANFVVCARRCVALGCGNAAAVFRRRLTLASVGISPRPGTISS